MKKLEVVFYLLILCLPIQLGKHFFFPFSYISGIRSDYLAPTVYLTDILSILVISISFCHSGKSRFGGTHPESVLNQKQHRSWTSQDDKKILFSVGLLMIYLLLSSLFLSLNPLSSLYKLVKLLEMGLLLLTVTKLYIHPLKVVLILSMGAVYSSSIAVAQFIKGGSLNGLVWILGERTFTLTTPGIATFSLNGIKFLRPYATFAHPNVLGGFLAIVVLLIIINFKKLAITKTSFTWYCMVLGISFCALILTMSRTAWIALGSGLILTRFKNLSTSSRFFLFLISILFSIAVPLIVPFWGESFSERKALIEKTFELIGNSPWVGVGLNVFIQKESISVNRLGASAFQPVHNVFLLVLSEIGLLGAMIMVFAVNKIRQVNSYLESPLFPIFFSLFFLSLFDHYLYTLQSGQLLVVVICYLVFLGQKKYT